MDISLRLNKEDTLLIKKYAEFNKLSVSELIRQIVLERIEDDYDLKVYNKAMTEYQKNPVTYTSLLIIAWIRKNLEECDNPRLYGKALVASKSGQWRYRIGDYRLLASIEDETITILILNVGHRKDIYK